MKFNPFSNFVESSNQPFDVSSKKPAQKMYSVDELDILQLPQLKSIAKDLGISHYSTLNKTPLVIKILENQRAKRF